MCMVLRKFYRVIDVAGVNENPVMRTSSTTGMEMCWSREFTAI